jgi:hypothetical protein
VRCSPCVNCIVSFAQAIIPSHMNGHRRPRQLGFRLDKPLPSDRRRVSLRRRNQHS